MLFSNALNPTIPTASGGRRVVGHWCPLERFADADAAVGGTLDRLAGADLTLKVTERVTLRLDADNEPTRVLLLLGPLPDTTHGLQPTLDQHTADVRDAAVRAAGRLALPGGITPDLFRLIGDWHDTGKGRKLWQDFIFNDGDSPLAKPGRRGTRGASYLRGYRHEFGSLRDLVKPGSSSDYEALTDEERDVVLHLIASHHGFARPHFKPPAMIDPTAPTAAVPDDLLPGEVARRFDRLQRRFGVWGLAWLEAIVRCADAAASGDAEAPTVGEDEEDA